MSFKYYILSAMNEHGAVVKFNGHTIRQALEAFDTEYHRKGFKITIRTNWDDSERVIKATFR